MSEVVTILGTIILALVGLVVLGVRFFILGKIVPQSTLIDKTKDFEAQIARERQISDEWRSVAMQVVPQLAKLNDQNERLLRSQETVEAVINAIPRPPTPIEGRPGGRT